MSGCVINSPYQGLLRQLREDPGARANAVGMLTNVGLAVAKFTVGALTGSAALIADGFNSAGDIVATAIAYAGYIWGQVPPDDNHHFGHGNAETVAGLLVGGILLATGVFISIEGLLKLLSGPTEAPGAAALGMALVTMVVKELLYRYSVAVGRRLNSPALLASSRDHRADVFVGLAVFAGVAGSRMGLPWLDPVAAIAIGFYIAWMAVEPIRDNIGVLMDEASPEMAAHIHQVARADDDVREVSEVRVHPLGSYFMVDLEIFVDGAMSLHAAHDVAHRVSARVCEKVPHVRDVKVHVNPTGVAPDVPRSGATAAAD